MKVPLLELKPAYDEVREACDQAYRRVMERGWYLLGGELEAFESEYAASVGASRCVGVANGLEALQLVLMALGVGRGDEVIVPAHGYIATWLAASQVGATVVPVECDEATYNLDPQAVAAALTERTRVILPIHLYGLPADMASLKALAARHGVFLLEDAAQSHGATQGGCQSGALGDAAGISFYPSKNLGALGDAGAVTTDDLQLDGKLRALRNYGSRQRYHHDARGLNSRMDELQAGFLRAKLPKLAEWNLRRDTLARRYIESLRGVGDLVLPVVPAGRTHAWHLFVVRTRRRETLREHLRRAGIDTQIHYPIPPHLSDAYADQGWTRGAFPLAERLAGEVVSLPISPHHTPDQIDYVCQSVRSFFSHA